MLEVVAEILPGNRPIVTRKQAKEIGLSRYFTGVACTRRHVAERFAVVGNCVECDRENQARRYAADPESKKAKSRSWRVDNPEKAKALDARKAAERDPIKERERLARWSKSHRAEDNERKRRWRLENPEAAKAREADYRARNIDRLRVASLKWVRDNPEKAEASGIRWRSANPDKIKVLGIRWRAANPERAKAIGAARRARELGAEGRYTDVDISRLMIAQRSKCAYCRNSLKSGHEVDHITPLKLGGSNWPRNLQLLCMPCNRRKSSKHPIVFAQKIGLLV